MQRRKASGDEAWLLSYADLITNLLIFFVMLLSAAEISRSKMQKDHAKPLRTGESSELELYPKGNRREDC